MDAGMENRHVAADHHRQSPQPSRESRALETRAYGPDGNCQSLRETKTCRRRREESHFKSESRHLDSYNQTVPRHHHGFQTRRVSFRYTGCLRIPRGAALLETFAAAFERMA